MCLAIIGSAFAQQMVTGTVVGESDGIGLPGVTVAEKGTSRGAITDLDGKFTIQVTSGKSTLVFSFVGMKTIEVALNDRKTLDVKMASEDIGLDEVVVTAMGIKRQEKSLGYAMSTIQAKDLVKVGSSNFGSALYGKASGVRIQAAPGGATSAVNINIRGTNSINFNSQPLIIVDGIPIRNGEANNAGYWDDQRIRGNGLIDINPEDIADLSILKGAAASALYGSEAANGVVLITTKKGTKGQGLGVDAGYNYLVETPAFLPPFQNEYGPGYDAVTNRDAFGADADGWLWEDLNGDGTKETPRPIYRAYANFGPKFDGRQVIGWDGQMHPYVAQPDNYKNLYRTGFNSQANIAINQSTEKGSYRFSYTRTDYQGVQRGGDHNKNNFNFTGSVNVAPKFKLDLGANFINQYTKNRPYKISRITNNFGGFLSRFDDAQWYLDKYKTSKGYYFRRGTEASATPDENIKYNPRAVDLLDYFWRTLANKNEEYQNRLITNATATWTIVDGLILRGKIGNDFTSVYTENREPNMYPISLGNSGSFGQNSDIYSNIYGDVLLSYNKTINNDFNILLNAGYTARKESFRSASVSTSGGLSTENWYHLNASVNSNKNAGGGYTELLKDAYFGTANFGYKSFAFIEFTGRYESSSTLPPGSNQFFYPSVSTSFIFSDAFHLQDYMDYGKLRVAYGIVGNSPSLYAANNAYTQNTVNNIVYNSLSSDYGNDKIRPEEKHEFEVGLEMKFFNNRLGFEATYYNNKIVDQILWLDVPKSTGAGRMLTNVGELSNKGFEGSINYSPLRSKDLIWDLRTNFSINRNKVNKLMPGVDRLVHRDIDAGAAQIISEPGKPMGDIYAYIPQTDANGNPVIDATDGLAVIDFTEMKKVGNAMPKIVGGFGSYLEYKNVFIDFTIDYKYGGEVVSLAGQYMKGAGMFEETLKYRDKEHGGVSYYVDASNKKIKFDGTQGPNGEKVYNDGVLLPGVNADGKPNQTIASAADYYLNTFTWGANPAWGIPYSRYDDAVKKNDYVKFRELSIGYNIPKSIAQKFKCNNVRVALVGSNLFYIYRTMKEFDSETTLGTNWVSAAIIDGSTAANRSMGFSIKASF
jgi:iron complex outermembrane receptor protein